MELCPPVLAYGIFMIALGLYDIYMGSFPNLARTLFYLIVGCILLWVLCAAGMGFAAWGLLAIPIVFYLFLFAILIFQKGFDVETETKTAQKTCGKPPAPAPSCEPEPEPECEEEPICSD